METKENPNAPSGPTTESMANARTVEQGEASPPAAVAATPSSSSAASSSAPARIVVGLPESPRVRLSWWFEGKTLKCEGVLMDEGRQPVRRALLDVDADPTFLRMFAYTAQKLVADLQASGVAVTAAAPAAPPSSSDEIQPTTAREGSTE